MDDTLKAMFTEGRSHHHWTQAKLDDEKLKEIHDIMRMGPTSANTCPLRIVFVKSPEAKARLKPCLSEGNIEQTMSAPVTAIFAHDMEFYEKLPKLFPHTDARPWFEGKPDVIDATALRNGTLQAAYFMMVARALGVDCGPMSGFDNAAVDKEFFSDSSWRSNFLCNLGIGDSDKLFPRHPRLDFDEACSIL